MVKIPDDWVQFARDIFGPGSPEIRKMRRDDVDEVLRIIRLHDSDDYRAAKRSFAHTSFDEAQDTAAHFLLIDPDEGRPIGVTGYYVDDLEAKGIYWLGWTYVNPFFRGKGHGSQLLHFVIRTVKRFGARKLYLSTSDLPEYDDAVRFYERFGFRLEGRLEDYFQQGEAKLIYGLEL